MNFVEKNPKKPEKSPFFDTFETSQPHFQVLTLLEGFLELIFKENPKPPKNPKIMKIDPKNIKNP